MPIRSARWWAASRSRPPIPASLVRTGRSAGCFRVVDGGACRSPGGIVADARAAVTDTHPLLFHAAGGRRLGRRAARLFAAAEARTALIYVPTAVMWETSLLSRVGRVDLRRSLREFFADLFGNPAYQGGACLRGGEHASRVPTEPAAPCRVKKKRVRVGDCRAGVSHDAAWTTARAAVDHSKTSCGSSGPHQRGRDRRSRARWCLPPSGSNRHERVRRHARRRPADRRAGSHFDVHLPALAPAAREDFPPRA